MIIRFDDLDKKIDNKFALLMVVLNIKKLLKDIIIIDTSIPKPQLPIPIPGNIRYTDSECFADNKINLYKAYLIDIIIIKQKQKVLNIWP